MCMHVANFFNQVTRKHSRERMWTVHLKDSRLLVMYLVVLFKVIHCIWMLSDKTVVSVNAHSFLPLLVPDITRWWRGSAARHLIGSYPLTKVQTWTTTNQRISVEIHHHYAICASKRGVSLVRNELSVNRKSCLFSQANTWANWSWN